MINHLMVFSNIMSLPYICWSILCFSPLGLILGSSGNKCKVNSHKVCDVCSIDPVIMNIISVSIDRYHRPEVNLTKQMRKFTFSI